MHMKFFMINLPCFYTKNVKKFGIPTTKFFRKKKNEQVLLILISGGIHKYLPSN